MSITNNCMVVNLQIGIWQGQRLDKEASRQVTETNGAHADAARVNKHIISKEALKPIIQAAGALRTHFYENTLPWKDNGDRLLTRRRFTVFSQEHGKLTTAFNDAVETFLTTAYPAAREQAEFRMGELFKSDDYPEVRELRHRFYANLDIDPVSTAGDFRVALDEQAADIVKRGMESALEARLKTATRDLWERLSRTLGRFAERMGDSEAIFRDSTVENLHELVPALRDMNVLEDPDLERVCSEIETRLHGYDAKQLRKYPEVRTAAANEAQEILDGMAGFMNAFGRAA
jgi:hypothetical protein